MMHFDLIIFDCDGTLTDSERLNNQAFLDIVHEQGFTHYTLDHAYHHWMGKTVSNAMLAIQMETGRMPSPDTVPRFVARVAELQKTQLKPVVGARDVVESLSKTHKICVASNGERSNVLTSLVLTDLQSFFPDEHVFTKIQVKNPKPAPDLFLYAAQQMGVDPERTLVIEDSVTGVLAGVAAGMTVYGTVAASHDPARVAKTLMEAGADRVFDDFIHILDFVSH